MRIIVCPHELAMGGSQINAIELAAAVRDRGHEVVVYAPDGVLAEKVAGLGLERVASPIGTRLSLKWSSGILKLARERRADLVHAYEWAPSIGTAFSAHVLLGTPLVMTVLSMDVPGFLPTHVPLIVGTRKLAAEQRGRDRVHIIEPPIDSAANQSTDIAAARNRWSASDEEILISVVCRMTDDLDKAEGVLEAISAVDALAACFPVRLLVVGGGPALERVSEHAANANRRHHRTIVEMAGNMYDPRPAYEAANVVLGMGSSALRGIAFGKPVIVQGAAGFWRLLTIDTVERFFWEGFYGHGGGGTRDLTPILVELLQSPALRHRLGDWGRSLVGTRFSLETAAEKLEEIYGGALAGQRRRSKTMLSMSQSAIDVAKFRLARALEDRAVR